MRDSSSVVFFILPRQRNYARIPMSEFQFVIIATENTEDAEMIYGNVPPLRGLRPFRLIAGLLAKWYEFQMRSKNHRSRSDGNVL
jgi:hypothetical protein